MPKFQDLTGQRFGRLTAIKRAEDHIYPSGNRTTMWLCRCDCGNEKVLNAGNLRSGNTTSCGCERHKPSWNYKDLTGKRVGKLTVLKRVADKKYSNSKYGMVMYLCRCDCGKEKAVSAATLLRGTTISCGCYGKKARADSITTHGGANERLYGVWLNMKYRCERPKNTNYKNYGGRGIKVYDEWHDYAVFREWAYANGYDENAKHGDCSIDRIDVDKGYSPDNCRWVGNKVQQNNRRNNVMLEYKGETHTVAQWSQITGISEKTIRARVKLGMPIEKILYGGDLRNERTTVTSASK